MPFTPPLRISTWLRASPKSFHPFLPIACADVWVQIAQHIPDPRDILNLCLTSRYMLSLLVASLYANVELKGTERCRKTLTALAQHPDICRHIRKLVLRPNWLKGPSEQRSLDERPVAHILESMACALPGLRVFEWDALEMPPDHLWLALRTSCPRLNSIVTSVGAADIAPDSHLFDFRDLISFSLMVKWWQATRLYALGERPIDQFPEAFWDMLLVHSPNLEALVIATTPLPPRFYDVRPITTGRWPRLRTLALGHTLIETDTTDAAARASLFVKFLVEHPTLENLSLPGQRHAIHPHNRRTSEGFPGTLAFLPPSALRLESFSGSFFAVRELPHPHILKHLALACEDHPSFFVPKLCGALRRLPALTSLKIWFDMSHSDPTRDETDHATVFHRILAACPGLLHLDLICSTTSKLTFRWEELAHALRDAPQLRTLVLSKVHCADEDMLQGAARLARAHPGLARMELRTAQGAWSHFSSMALRKRGRYDVLRDARGAAVGLVVDECGQGLLSRVVRRYRYSLVPVWWWRS